MLDKERETREQMIALLQYEDLSVEMQIIAENAGMEVVKTLLLTCAGERFYVPKLERITELLKRYLINHYDPATISDKDVKLLSTRIRLSEIHIRSAIRSINADAKTA